MSKCDIVGQTPLFIASSLGKANILEVLVSKNDNTINKEYLNSPNRPKRDKKYHGLSALHVAAKQGNLEACKKLVELGADTEYKSPSKRTALQIAKCYKTVGHKHVAE